MSFAPKAVAESQGLYRDANGFWVRPIISGKRTWRKLRAITLRAAMSEAKQVLDQHALYLAGESKTSPFIENANTFRHVSALYLAAGCPHHKFRSARSDKFCAGERARIEWLVKFFGDKLLDEINHPLLVKHAEWRIPQCSRGGARVVELEWVTLSNVISYAVFNSLATFNHIRQQRPQLRADDPGESKAARIRHSREVAPSSGDVVHQIAGDLFKDQRGETSAFVWLFACLTGLRLSELLALRLDAKPPINPSDPDCVGEPGYTDDKFLHVHRGKRSKRHKVLLFPELADLLSAHFRWHQARYPNNPWYFPGRNDGQRIDTTSPGHRVAKSAARLGLPHLTMHGARSFFTTVLRSQGLREAEIAWRIGDKTVQLIAEAYGGSPDVWHGGLKLSWLPKEGEAAWAKWNPIKPAASGQATPSPSPKQ